MCPCLNTAGDPCDVPWPCRYAERFYQRVAHEIIDNYEELVESADPSASVARSISTDVRISL